MYLRKHSALIALVMLMTAGTTFAQSSDWAQWGGPQRNFKSDTTGLAASWPAAGPRRIWQRELGEGYSAIAAEHGTLYTMYRKGENEIVIALDAATGKTLWEYGYAAPFSPQYDMSNGPGPHATPLVTGNLLFTSGATGKLHCLELATGRVVWMRDIDGEFKVPQDFFGTATTPLLEGNLLIINVGAPLVLL